jgi:hypothetical protein
MKLLLIIIGAGVGGYIGYHSGDMSKVVPFGAIGGVIGLVLVIFTSFGK